MHWDNRVLSQVQSCLQTKFGGGRIEPENMRGVAGRHLTLSTEVVDYSHH